MSNDNLRDTQYGTPVPREETVCGHCSRIERAHLPMPIEGREVLFCNSSEHTKFTPRVPDTPGAIPEAVGDGSCDRCGKMPAIIMPTSLCDECVQGVKRAEAAESRIGVLEAERRELHTLRPRSEYHEDFGCVLWWRVPIEEPPIVDGYDIGELDWSYTHWSPLPQNPALAATQGKQE